MGSDRDRFVGCLLGHAIGDALGAPVEGMPAQSIYYEFGGGGRLVARPPGEALCYTDDTEMSIGVAETLLARGRIEEDALMAAFAANYDPGRGYGPGTRRILDAMVSGRDWRAAAIPGGSFGNGAAMRVAPVGLLYCDDLDRVADAARESAMPTHGHAYGVEGAQLVAVAVALAMRGRPLDRRGFFSELIGRARTDEFQWVLRTASRLGADDSLHMLGNTLEAHRSVGSAIACFAQEPESYTEVIARAINLGGDTDTIAAMAGAMSGAHLGVSAIPQRLIESLEDGPKGRTYIESLAVRLWEVRCMMMP